MRSGIGLPNPVPGATDPAGIVICRLPPPEGFLPLPVQLAVCDDYDEPHHKLHDRRDRLTIS